MRGTAREVGTNSYMTYSCGPLHMDEQRRAGLLEPYIQQICADTGCSLEVLPEAMDDREGWRERVRDICLVWFGLVSLFNGISTLYGYLMPKQFSLKNSSCTI